MAKALKAVAIVAAVVAVSFAIPGVGSAMAGAIIGSTATAASAAALAATIAAVASAVSTVASAAAMRLQKPPDMRGTVSQVMIGANMPIPYAMGRTYIGGNQVYDKSANGPDNYDRTQIFVGSAAGPIEGFEKLQADYTTIGFSDTAGGIIAGVAVGFYGADDGYLWVNSRLGERPSTALTPYPGRAAFSNWGPDYKLSGYAAWAITMEFDEDGKRWASGIPQWGVIAKWVKVYDPRLDSTYPGGSGSQRWDDEATWEWSENPGLHALTYVRGRFVNGVKVVGAGIPKPSIDIAKFVELANICDANGWTVGGAVYEGPGLSKWNNLKTILAAGMAEPAWVGGKLSLKLTAPRVALYTIGSDDLTDASVEVAAMNSWKDRFNTIVPRYRSEAHRWEYVQADAVTNTVYLTEDGEPKTDEVQFDLVQDKDQAAQLAGYTLANRREFGPIRITVKPWLMSAKIGEAAELHIPEAGLDGHLAIIIGRSIDAATGSIALTLQSETTAKHAWALSQTGVAPPTPVIVTPEDMDSGTSDLEGRDIANSYPVGLTITAEEDGDIVISNHTRRFTDGSPDIAVTGATIASGLVAGDFRAIAYDDPSAAGGAVTYQLFEDDIDARVSTANRYRYYVGYAIIPTAGSGSSTGGGSTPPGGNCVTTDTPILIGEGVEKPAGEIAVGDLIWTRHEASLKWDFYRVEAVEIVEDQPVLKATIGGKMLRATADHRVYLALTGWTKMADIGAADGTAAVVKMTVTGAHTYVSNGVLSHNIKGG